MLISQQLIFMVTSILKNLNPPITPTLSRDGVNPKSARCQNGRGRFFFLEGPTFKYSKVRPLSIYSEIGLITIWPAKELPASVVAKQELSPA